MIIFFQERVMSGANFEDLEDFYAKQLVCWFMLEICTKNRKH